MAGKRRTTAPSGFYLEELCDPGFDRRTRLINRNPLLPSRRVHAKGCLAPNHRNARGARIATLPDTIGISTPGPPPERADRIEWGQRVPSWLPDSAANLAVRS